MTVYDQDAEREPGIEDHVTDVEETPLGFLAICHSCSWTAAERVGSRADADWERQLHEEFSLWLEHLPRTVPVTLGHRVFVWALTGFTVGALLAMAVSWSIGFQWAAAIFGAICGAVVGRVCHHLVQGA